MTQQRNLAPSEEIMIQINDMNKWYGEFHVLKNINLTVKKGRKNRYLWPFRLREIDHDSLY